MGVPTFTLAGTPWDGRTPILGSAATVLAETVDHGVEVTDSSTQLVGRDGATFSAESMTDRHWTVTATLLAKSEPDPEMVWWRLLAAIRGTSTGAGRPALVPVTIVENGRALSSQAIQVGRVTDTRWHGGHRRFQFELRSPDPRLYFGPLVTITPGSTHVSSTLVAVKPLITVAGPTSADVLATNGYRTLRFSGRLSAGETLYLDGTRRLARKVDAGGVVSWQNYTGNWWDIAPGDNVLGAGGGAAWTGTYRAAVE